MGFVRTKTEPKIFWTKIEVEGDTFQVSNQTQELLEKFHVTAIEYYDARAATRDIRVRENLKKETLRELRAIYDKLQKNDTPLPVLSLIGEILTTTTQS